jgi:hypothetical protein
MATQATHEHFEEHLLAREQFMIGGRDTAIVVWLALSLLLLLFLLLSGLAGDPPLPSTSSVDSPGTSAALTEQTAMNLR